PYAIQGKQELVGSVYGRLANALAEMHDEPFNDYGVRPRVYCCGYDWRLDNARSAMRLAAVVDRALTETRARQVIIVAHSMGGLIARYYCRVLGGESKVHQLYLVGSPTLGAASAYYQLKRGMDGAYVRDFVQALDQDEPLA